MATSFTFGDTTFTLPDGPGRMVHYLDRPQFWVDVRGKRLCIFSGANLSGELGLLVTAPLAEAAHALPEAICFLDFYLINEARTVGRWIRVDAPRLPRPEGGTAGRGVAIPKPYLRVLTPVELSTTGGQLVWAQRPGEPPAPEDFDVQVRQAASGGGARPSRDATRQPGKAQKPRDPVTAWYANASGVQASALLSPPRYRGGPVQVLLAHPKAWSDQESVQRAARMAEQLTAYLGQPIKVVRGIEDFQRRFGEAVDKASWDLWPTMVTTASTGGRMDYHYLVVPTSSEGGTEEKVTLGTGTGRLVEAAFHGRLPVLVWDAYQATFHLGVSVQQVSMSFTHGWELQVRRTPM